MALHVGTTEVIPSAKYHFWYGKSKLKEEAVVSAILDRLGIRVGSFSIKPVEQETATAVTKKVNEWVNGGKLVRVATLDELADLTARELKIGRRKNAFFQDKTENSNISTVISHSVVSTSSVGWSEQKFFAELGDPRHKVGSEPRNAEQEYLLQNMVKGALFEAAQIADKHNVGISVRGTGLLAHMGIEMGNPTKAQEFKNKTSKEMDLWLCDEMTFGDVGAVMHYDPRVGWKSSTRSSWKEATARPKEDPTDWDKWFEEEWTKKKVHIENWRANALATDIKAKRISLPSKQEEWDKLKDWFKSRINEYREENHEYTVGHYKDYTELVGPFVHLKDRPDVHMYGDHDLFAFSRLVYGRLVHDSIYSLGDVQTALQDANVFQAQHGGIWNWKPAQSFHVDIKKKIMGAHSPPDGEPLVYITPGYVVTAAFYIPAESSKHEDRLVSAWEFPEATKWLTTTYSGKKLLERLTKQSSRNKTALL